MRSILRQALDALTLDVEREYEAKIFQNWYDESIPRTWLTLDELQHEDDYFDEEAAYERMCDYKMSMRTMGEPWWAQ